MTFVKTSGYQSKRSIFCARNLRSTSRKRNTNFRKCITVKKRVAITLWRLATNAEYRTISHLFAVGRSTCCKIANDTCKVITDHLMPKYICLPTGQRLIENIRDFRRINGFPQVGGAIDGTHIPIVAPRDNPADYYNRKGWYSMVCQAVVDANYCFTNVYVGWPGRVHDARIFSNSDIYRQGENGELFPQHTVNINGTEIPVFLLGDAAYPLKSWLMRPFSDFGNLTYEQKTFNYKHSSTRMVVEGSFGRLKGRWRCLLKRLDVATVRVPYVVCSCCTLHNFCEVHGDGINEQWLNGVVGGQDNVFLANLQNNQNNYAENIRVLLRPI
ncbi:unnamed protein product [Mytilus edulis]|uniref:DDE Tnp4 domain-containing protein n=1 Tax=Mytilus edulis TaxID=6550 RepID=A0A8S3V9W0_MYTED|nr:unnamed protein product [Mytilus edulis]